MPRATAKPKKVYDMPVFTIDGDGFKDILNYWFPKRTAGKLPPKVRSLLAKIGGEKITSLQIVRTPIQTTLYNILNLVSFDAFKNWLNSNSYDAVYHLSLFINGKYMIEKNEVINFEVKNPIVKGSEVITIPVPTGYSRTILQLLNDTKEQLGDEAFTSYEPFKNNCQNFVLALVKASGLLTQDIEKFIVQPVQDLLQRVPTFVQKFGSELVDLAGRVDRFVAGEGFLDVYQKMAKSSGEGVKSKSTTKPFKTLKDIEKEQKYKSCVEQVSKTNPEGAIPICKVSVMKLGILNKIKKRLKKLKVPFVSVEMSTVKGKRFKITMKDGTVVHFGSPEGETFLDKVDEAKQRAYIARASAQKYKDGTRYIDKLYSPSWFSFRILWGGEL